MDAKKQKHALFDSVFYMVVAKLNPQLEKQKNVLFYRQIVNSAINNLITIYTLKIFKAQVLGEESKELDFKKMCEDVENILLLKLYCSEPIKTPQQLFTLLLEEVTEEHIKRV